MTVHCESSQAFKLVPFASIQIDTQSTAVVKGLIPSGGLTVVYGPPKSGKSFLMLDVYVVAEGSFGFRARKVAFEQAKMIAKREGVPFFMLGVPINLVVDHVAFIRLSRETLGDDVPVMVIIDTLNRTLAGSENSPDAMGDYIRATDGIRTAFDCAVVVVHHCGVDGVRPRGHSSLTGAADAQLAVRRSRATDVISLTVEEMKDGPDGAVFMSRLDRVIVGHDDDGDEISSCIVVDASGEVNVEAKSKLSARAIKALACLMEAIEEDGVASSEELAMADGVEGASLKLWRRKCKAAGLTSSLNDDAVKKAFVRARRELEEAELILIDDDIVFPLPTEDVDA